MLNDSHIEKLKTFLKELGYLDADILEIISAYTAIMPVFAKVAKRVYLKGQA